MVLAAVVTKNRNYPKIIFIFQVLLQASDSEDSDKPKESSKKVDTVKHTLTHSVQSHPAR